MRIIWPSSRRARWSIFLTVSAVLIAIAFALDDWGSRLAAEPIRSGQMRTTLVALRFFGDGAPIVLLTLLAVSIAPKSRIPAAMALVAALLSGLIVDRAKTLTARRRPIETLPAPPRESWTGSDNNGRNSSFPSGHSATAFGFARGMSLAFPAVGPVAYLAAGGTALSRMHELRHYPSDCVVGGLLGWSMATFLWSLRSRVLSRKGRKTPSEDAPDVLPLMRSA